MRKEILLMGLMFLLPSLAFATMETSFNLHLQAFNLVNTSASGVNMALDIFGTSTCSGTPLFTSTCSTDVNGVCDIPITMNTSFNTIYYACVYANSSLISGSPSSFRAGQGQISDEDVAFNNLTANYFYGDGSQLTNLNISNSQYWSRYNFDTIIPTNDTDHVILNNSLIMGIANNGLITGNGNHNLTVQGGNGYCFSGETLISTPTGSKQIKNLIIGNSITSYDVITSQLKTSKVTSLTSHIETEYYVINGNTEVTGEHYFWTDSGWKKANTLTTSDKLFDGSSWITISSINHIFSNITVYHLITSDPYTFFADGLLVHNKDLVPRIGRDLFLHGGYPYMSPTEGNTYIAYDGANNVGNVYVGGDMSLYSDLDINGTAYAYGNIYANQSIYLTDNMGFYLDTLQNNAIYYDTGIGQLVITTDNGTYFDNTVTATYFIGDGSQLTNITATAFNETDPLWTANESSVARTGDCPFGEFVINTTTAGVQCQAVLTSETYLPTSITTITGTVNSGNLTSVWYVDTDYYNVSEINLASNPIEIVANFSNANITTIDSIIVKHYYTGSLGHEILVQLWNYNTSAWDNYGDITDESGFVVSIYPVLDPANHILNGNMSMRFLHVQTGIGTHILLLDYIAVQKGTTTVTNSEHDSLSGRDSITNHPWAMDINGTRNITNLQVTNNITANYFIGDGSQLTNLNISNSQYWTRSGTTLYPTTYGDSLDINGDVQIAGAYGKRLYLDNTLTKYIWANNVTNNIEIAPSLNVTGNATAQNFLGNINWSYIQNAPTIPIQYWNRTGTLLIPATAGDDIFIDLGTITTATDIQLTGNVTNYLQHQIKNKNNGTTASTDYVATAGHGDETSFYVDLGINSQTYNVAGYNISGANDSYLYAQNGSLSIGTSSAGKNLIFHTGGTTTANGRALITDAGLLPYLTNTYSLGNSSLYWSSFYSTNATIGNSTGNTTITPTETTLFGTARVNKTIQNYAYNVYGLAGTYNGNSYSASTGALLGQTIFQQLQATVVGGDVGTAFIYNFITPQDRVTGSNFSVIVHYMDASTETCNIVMGVGERHSANTESYSQTDTWVQSTFAVPTTQYLKSSREFTFDGSAIENGNAVAITVYRNGETGTDTCSGIIDVSSLEVVYLSNKI